jgi:membrane protein DedA with SNARE-associated domain
VEQITPYIEKFSYLGIFVMILLFSFVLPFSKTLVVLAGGVLAAEDMGNLYLFMLVSLLGLVTADSIYFGIGNLWGEKILRIPYFSRGGRKEKLIEAERRFMRHGWFAVFSARFTPFIRGLIFMVAGASGMSLLRFFQADILSALIMVPLASLLGYFFAEKRSIIYDYINEGEYILAVIVGGILLTMIFVPGMKKDRGK